MRADDVRSLAPPRDYFFSALPGFASDFDSDFASPLLSGFASDVPSDFASDFDSEEEETSAPPLSPDDP
jgi:hypothetical protein